MKAAYVVFLSVSFLILSLIMPAPYLGGHGYDGYSGFVAAVFSGFCHQRPDRSLFLFGNQMPVCARCFGIYFGMFAGALAYPLLNKGNTMPSGKLFVAAAAPLVVDGLTQLLGLRESTNGLRFLTGLLFGIFMPVYLIPAMQTLFEGGWSIFIRQRR